MDGLNLLLIMLTTLLGPIVVLSSWTYIGKAHKGYYALILLLETGVLGVFASFDLFLFYVFFELTLIPMVFIIGIWGGEDRVYAAVKFVIYTLVGSLLMLVGVIWLGFAAGDAVNGGVFTTDWYKLVQLRRAARRRSGGCSPLRAGVRDQGAALPAPHLAAGRAHAGADGRLGRPGRRAAQDGDVRPAASSWSRSSRTRAARRCRSAILAVIGIVYGALVAFAQTDVKKLVAYSSVSHLGFVVLGVRVRRRRRCRAR